MPFASTTESPHPPHPPHAAATASTRAWELDALRGLMLVLMTLTHLPTRLSDPFGQPFGFVSAAEGFVLLSAFMAGKVYTAKQRRDGDEVMRSAFLKRALKIYLCQAALLAFLMTVIALIGWVTDQPAIENLISFYTARPLTALLSGLLLVYSPPLLDILPMYIVFMLLSPVLLLHAMHRGWSRILAISVAVWLAAQFDLGHALYDALSVIAPIPVPFRETGSFEILAWQFVWVLGLWMGSTQAMNPQAPPTRFPRWLVHAAIGVAMIGFVWRHAIGQVPLPTMRWLDPLFDKWHLGPVRLINFFALLVVTMTFAGALRRIPRVRALETMGQASLPVFCAHLVCALFALAIFGEVTRERPLRIDAFILGVTFSTLYLVAWITQNVGRQTSKVKERVVARVRERREVRRLRGERRGWRMRDSIPMQRTRRRTEASGRTDDPTSAIGRPADADVGPDRAESA